MIVEHLCIFDERARWYCKRRFRLHLAVHHGVQVRTVGLWRILHLDFSLQFLLHVLGGKLRSEARVSNDFAARMWTGHHDALRAAIRPQSDRLTRALVAMFGVLRWEADVACFLLAISADLIKYQVPFPVHALLDLFDGRLKRGRVLMNEKKIALLLNFSRVTIRFVAALLWRATTCVCNPARVPILLRLLLDQRVFVTGTVCDAYAHLRMLLESFESVRCLDLLGTLPRECLQVVDPSLLGSLLLPRLRFFLRQRRELDVARRDS